METFAPALPALTGPCLRLIPFATSPAAQVAAKVPCVPSRLTLRVHLSLIGSGAEDCASAPSHTTGRAVFRIRRLNAAVLFTHGPQGLMA
jgi:hypothetical protein